jgi:hypothetical protein
MALKVVYPEPMGTIPHNQRVILILNDASPVIGIADYRESPEGVFRRILIAEMESDGPHKSKVEWTELVGVCGADSLFQGWIPLPDIHALPQ